MVQAFQLIALTLPGFIDPSIPIAASRAGELGVLNLEHTRDEKAARDAIARMTRYTGQGCGIKLDSGAPALVECVTSDLPEQVGVVILTPSDPEALRQQVSALRQRRLTVLLEATSLEHAQLGEQLGVDGLIAKGNEAGGWIGEETTFILLQHLLSEINLPIWAQGGIGLHTAAACYVAGAAGVVLDSQLALTRESQLPAAAKEALAAMDGSETVCLGGELGATYRMYARPGLPIIEELRELISDDSFRNPQSAIRNPQSEWHQAVEARVGWGASQEHVWPLGQDAIFAAPLAQRYRTVGGVLGAIREAISTHIQAARTLRLLDEGAPLARSHGTRYPIVQGPMARVSDRAEFAWRVAEGGALPLLAMAMMRAPEVSALLEETQQLLGERPWGVGILGFVPLDLRKEQMQVIRQHCPPFALIAGGRPDQARELENEGILTYLHVPSPELLRLYLQDGARRFVFEGHEGGGHVGPRSSFVLWNTMVDVLLEELPHVGRIDNSSYHVLFAGGIHDALSASMVAALAAPLAERGVRVGVLLGTSYLFTEEAVASGAILPRFQKEALRCDHTVLLETGPGHVVRCAETPYVRLFEQEKQRLRQEGKLAGEIRETLEAMNVGRLRIASKGIDRHPRYGNDPEAPRFIRLSEEDQHCQGMYMIGQLAALRDRTCSIEELHREVAIKSSQRLENLATAGQSVAASLVVSRPSEIAIVGMSCVLPKAPDLQAFWENVLNRVNAITEIPKDRWDGELYYDADPKARDKVYSRWGGFINDVPFDPLEFGMPPNSLPSIDPMHLLALTAVREALADAGYTGRPFDRGRTSVILGASGGVGDLGAAYVLRSGLPLLFGEGGFDIAANAGGLLPEWTEDSFAGLLLNVAAGRIANRFDFGGLNYVVDAACASSLTAVHLAVKELETHNTDIVIAGGVDTVQNPFGYLCFSKTQALSPTGQPRVFDAAADGIIISEGVVMLVLKRLADAERDGDRIYAVIQAVGGSSDGRAMGLTAPRPEGQVLAFQRAYAKAGFSPTTVELFEAHGTGTVVGDRAEALSLSNFLEREGAKPQSHAIGSVKSMIGHTKATAGVAGLAKVALALYHKVLPPTLGVTQPNPKARFGEGPLYINSETRPWIHGVQDHPRRAGVSAFGFGGTNFHAVLEEYTGDFLARQRETMFQRWPSELLVWSAQSRQELVSAVESLEGALNRGAAPELRDLAYTLNLQSPISNLQSPARLSIVATSLDDLRQKLSQARESLSASGLAEINDPRGIYCTEEPLAWSGSGQSEIRNPKSEIGKVAFLFPGQGSQYPNMLRDLAVAFPEVRETFEQTDQVLADRFPKPLSSYVFPPPAFTPDEEHVQQQALTQTNVAQPALGAADMGLFRLLQGLGVQPDLLAGHSYGEYAALCAAGVIDLETLAILSEARGRAIIEAAQDELGTMAAVEASADDIASTIESVAGVCIANLNAPKQTIISGTKSGIAEAIKCLEAQGISARPIPVACAFHSSLVAPAQQRLAEVLSRTDFAVPAVDVFSNTTSALYPRDPLAIRELLAEHLVRPVRFADEIEAMYKAGARLFVEVGPRNVLTGLASQTIGERPHVAIAVDMPRRHGLTQLQHALGQLAAHGVPLQLGRLFEGRKVRRLNLNALEEETKEEPLSPTTWLVNGSRARPLTREQGSKGAREQGRPAPTSRGSALCLPPTAQQPRDPTVPTAQPPSMAPAPGVAQQAGDEAGQVMLRFQHLMQRFLETQQNVMLAYLQGTPDWETGKLVNWETGNQSTNLPIYQSTNLPTPETPEEVSAPAESTPTLPCCTGEGRGGGGYLDREVLTVQLLDIVSERTGYPTDMLDLDLDIEANLGVDSIKRVEILGRLRELVPSHWKAQELDMERLSGLKTLRGIVDAIIGPSGNQGMRESGTRESGNQGLGNEEMPDSPITDSLITDSLIGRFTLRAMEHPLPERPGTLAPGRVVLITDDGTGVAQVVSAQLQQEGHPVVVLPRSQGSKGAREQGPCDPATLRPCDLAPLIERIRAEHGPIAGLVHLLPLGCHMSFDGMDLPAWREQLSLQVRSLFLLAKALRPDLEAAAQAGGAAVVAVSGMGGTFASEGASPFFPGHGALTGFLKTLAEEWPTVRVKAVDLYSQEDASTLAGYLLAELMADDHETEVGYAGGRRVVLEPVPSPLPAIADCGLRIAESEIQGSVLLVTGGARGITAEVAQELAERYQPTLLLVGRSPLPPAEESPDTAELTEPKELKSALIARLGARGQPVAPAQVEREYERLLKDREMRTNMAAMAQAGASVHYYSVDVCDERAFGALIDDIYQSFGRLDGVIHGAGIIEDKLVKDKAVESFDRVFSTKVESAFILSRYLHPESLRFLVFFSSVAACFGNRGQADYAAANEVLNKLAVYLDRRWSARVVSINWGPWEKRGMVSPELQRQFAERGVQLISPTTGRRVFDRELRYGRKSDVEVVVAGSESTQTRNM